MATWKFSKNTMFESNFYREGDSITFNDIPPPGVRLEPMDDDALRWEAYGKYREENPDQPKQPWCMRRARLVFPNIMPGYVAKHPEPELPDRDPEPRYLLAETAAVGPVIYEKGMEAGSSDWPKSPHLQPLNDSAQKIQQYWRNYSHIPGLRDQRPYVDGKINLPHPASFFS